MRTALSSSWQIARVRFSTAVATSQGRQWLAIRRAALLAERELKKGLRSGAPGGQRFKPLALSTTLLRGGKKPLLDTGSLLGSITTNLNKGRKSAFVGVLRTARKNGDNLMNVAVAHEFGTKRYVVKVTPAMRRFFWVLHFKSGGRIKPFKASTTWFMHPGVPARPFVRPVIRAIRPRLEREIRVVFGRTGGI